MFLKNVLCFLLIFLSSPLSATPSLNVLWMRWQTNGPEELLARHMLRAAHNVSKDIPIITASDWLMQNGFGLSVAEKTMRQSAMFRQGNYCQIVWECSESQRDCEGILSRINELQPHTVGLCLQERRYLRKQELDLRLIANAIRAQVRSDFFCNRLSDYLALDGFTQGKTLAEQYCSRSGSESSTGQFAGMLKLVLTQIEEGHFGLARKNQDRLLAKALGRELLLVILESVIDRAWKVKLAEQSSIDISITTSGPLGGR